MFLGHTCALADDGRDVGAAALDHLVANFREELGNAFGGVVEARHSVDHLDGMHQAGDVIRHSIGQT